jgi:hypothetical protein
VNRKTLQRAALAVIISAALIAALVFILKTGKPNRPVAAASSITPATSPRIPPDSLTANRRISKKDERAAEQGRAGESDPEMIGIKETLRSYRNAFGENPIGTNAEITRAVTGGNSRQAKFADSGVRIKAGQMVDQWDHPYFFHQLTRTQMEIRSAGPDGVMWTKDDEVLR